MVKPLKARTMGLAELQLATMDLIRKVRFQFGHKPHDDGMTDNEFLEEIVDPFEQKILADRSVIRDKRRKQREQEDE